MNDITYPVATKDVKKSPETKQYFDQRLQRKVQILVWICFIFIQRGERKPYCQHVAG